MKAHKKTEESEAPSTPLRRGSRLRRQSLKALESVPVRISPRKSQRFRAVEDEEDLSDLESETEETHEKPQILHENEAVGGDKLFTFQTRKARNSLLVKAVNMHEQMPKTPHALRNQLKKKIAAKFLEENESSGSDYSDSGSEYVASESEVESEENLSEADSDSSVEQIPKKTLKTQPKFASTSKNIQASKKASRKYTIKTEDYFSNHSTKKILTSNHTLDKLDTPRLPQDQLQKLLSKLKLGDEHSTAINNLVASNTSYFDKWLYLLHENFNILLYGLGSKKDVLNTFHQENLKDLPVIVVNGFFPSLTIKDILDSVILELLELKENPANIHEACELIEKEFDYIPDIHLYVIVHNIDMLRSGKTQNILARLASVKNIHFIVSIDHINAPLIWDHSKLSKFNFTWWDVTSFQQYIDETSFESSMMVQRSGTLALSSLRNVFLSLTSNSKGIYIKLVKYQLENSKDQYYQGLAFKDLYSSCREAFLVSSDLALRAQLTEFLDHKMVKFKRSADGTEYLIIPIPNTLLQQFLNEQST